ncbi:hypothetical protein NCLIV_034860 [Neospora caninum Liverpool]|uniref:Uncharacterized protein n=1 Tax=Neospora caninum (strain Liverpool) TaxID=572307 RepID=F0VIZ4_NEOCL|nr:hypothetical protein NCLIV_034860 [Neospora caninum Liverpool]CBZ53705.1 hypothetical protein NCLIV_034860 [Neospora caninum Liverpool]|eukprot:XP_003883737.1 hypothetical protein NCLIV_034860 [Neospora caninum Liverpool]
MYQLHNTMLNGSMIHVTVAKKGRSDPMQMQRGCMARHPSGSLLNVYAFCVQRRRELRGDVDREGRRRGDQRRQWDSSRSPPYNTRRPSSGGHRQKGDWPTVSRRARRSRSRQRGRRDTSRSCSR